MNEQNEGIHSGNDSSDFQPPTQDPQSNVGGGLQPVSGGLQPVSGESSGSQSLPQTQSLKVEDNGEKLTQSTAQQSAPSEGLNSFPLAFSVGIGLLLVVTVIIIWLAAPQTQQTELINTDEQKPESAPKPNKKKPKKKKLKSKTRKKR